MCDKGYFFYRSFCMLRGVPAAGWLHSPATYPSSTCWSFEEISRKVRESDREQASNLVSYFAAEINWTFKRSPDVVNPVIVDEGDEDELRELRNLWWVPASCVKYW